MKHLHIQALYIFQSMNLLYSLNAIGSTIVILGADTNTLNDTKTVSQALLKTGQWYCVKKCIA